DSTNGDAHAFRYTSTPSGGIMEDLGALYHYSAGYAINDAGQVAGWSYLKGTIPHAFLYTGTPGSGGAMADLGHLGGTSSYGYAINNSGQVVGQSYAAIGAHAFLYTGTPGIDGHMIDLDAWLDAVNPTEGAKWALVEARGISDSGLIT